MHSPFFPPLRRWASLVLTLLLCNSSPGVVIVEENFSYATTAWNSAINGNYNGGAGSWSGSWMYNPGLHSNPGAAIFGLSGYEPYGPQQAYAQGHGGGIERTISLTLSATAGSVYYFAADLFTPELDPAGPTAIYLNFGGRLLLGHRLAELRRRPGIQDGRAYHVCAQWCIHFDSHQQPHESLGAWQRLQARVEFTGTNSIMTAWLNASSEGDSAVTLTSTATNFTSMNFVIQHWGGASYGLADNVVLGTAFQDIAAVPEPSTWGVGLVMVLAGLAVIRRRRESRA